MFGLSLVLVLVFMALVFGFSVGFSVGFCLVLVLIYLFMLIIITVTLIRLPFLYLLIKKNLIQELPSLPSLKVKRSYSLENGKTVEKPPTRNVPIIPSKKLSFKKCIQIYWL